MGMMDKITGRAKQALGDLKDRGAHRQERQEGQQAAPEHRPAEERVEQQARQAGDVERKT